MLPETSGKEKSVLQFKQTSSLLLGEQCVLKIGFLCQKTRRLASRDHLILKQRFLFQKTRRFASWGLSNFENRVFSFRMRFASRGPLLILKKGFSLLENKALLLLNKHQSLKKGLFSVSKEQETKRFTSRGHLILKIRFSLQKKGALLFSEHQILWFYRSKRNKLCSTGALKLENRVFFFLKKHLHSILHVNENQIFTKTEQRISKTGFSLQYKGNKTFC